MRNSLFWRNCYIMKQGVRREWYDRTAVWEKWERLKKPGIDRIKGLAGRVGEKRRDDYATKGVWLWCSAQQQYFALNITALWQLHMIFEWHFAWNFCIIQYWTLEKGFSSILSYPWFLNQLFSNFSHKSFSFGLIGSICFQL